MRVIVRFFVAVLMAGAGVAVGTVALGSQMQRVSTAGFAGTGGDPLSLDPLAARSVVYARDGSVLATLHEEENRVPVSIDTVPEQVQRAVLDAEDDRFYEHGAIDMRAVTRAMVVNVQAGGIYEGGSTITQQLIKITLLNSQQKADRKIKEAALALRLEENMTKRQILERYINAVYLGNHAYGLEAGAETYFRKHVDQLDMGEGILLASLIRDPVGADPFTQPDAARKRRDTIVDRMHDLGHLSLEDAAAIKAAALPTPGPPEPVRGSDYFTEQVKKQLLDDPRIGASPKERFNAVFKGGLSVHTTLDPLMQQQAEQSVADIVPDTGGRFRAALVSVDPTSGAVRALVGGSDFASTKFDLATQGRRQAGSSFKAFTLMAALEAGYSPNDTILGAGPCSIPNPGGEPWTPGNVEGEAPGVITLTDATVHSINCAYARLVTLVGPAKVAEVANRMGITSHLDPFPSITLGTMGVSPLDMAGAYATLAADGQKHPTYFVDDVVDAKGHVVLKADTHGEQVVSPQNARTETQVLKQVVTRGTGTAAGVDGWTAAGKTGTTDLHTNAWFVGYTPTLSTAVWMGSPEGDVPMYGVGGITVFGGTYPARIWHQFMAGALGSGPAVGFPEPDPNYNSRYLSIDEQPQPPTRRQKPVPIASTGPDVAVAEPAPTPVPAAAPTGKVPSVDLPPVGAPAVPVITVPDRRPRPRPTR